MFSEDGQLQSETVPSERVQFTNPLTDGYLFGAPESIQRYVDRFPNTSRSELNRKIFEFALEADSNSDTESPFRDALRAAQAGKLDLVIEIVGSANDLQDRTRHALRILVMYQSITVRLLHCREHLGEWPTESESGQDREAILRKDRFLRRLEHDKYALRYHCTQFPKTFGCSWMEALRMGLAGDWQKSS